MSQAPGHLMDIGDDASGGAIEVRVLISTHVDIAK
jgi:hypothetical protein